MRGIAGIVNFRAACREKKKHISLLYTPKSLFREVERAGFRGMDRSNSVRTFGLGKIGRCLSRLLYAATDLDSVDHKLLPLDHSPAA